MLKRIDGLRLRIALVLVMQAVMLVAIVVLIVRGAGGGTETLFRLTEPADVAEIAAAIESVPHAARTQVAAAVSVGSIHVALIGEATGEGEATWPAGAAHDPEIDQELAAYRAALDGRAFHIQSRGGAAMRMPVRGQIVSLAPIRVLVRLKTGELIAIERTAYPAVARLVSRMWLILACLAALNLLIVLVLAGQVAIPVARLARAVGNEAQPWSPASVGGPREIRELALAFDGLRRRLRNLVDERTRLLAAVAHDFRTYLTRLKLRTDHIADERQRLLALADIEEMESVIDGALTLGETTAPGDAASVTDIGALVEAALANRRELGDPVIAGELPPALSAQIGPVEARRILDNLIDNAIRYAGRAVLVAGREGGRVWFAVEDDGPGVAPGNLAALAEPFWREEGSRARHTGGAGLGLAIVHALVTRAGGTLDLANRVEGGFRARVWLRAVAGG